MQSINVYVNERYIQSHRLTLIPKYHAKRTGNVMRGKLACLYARKDKVLRNFIHQRPFKMLKLHMVRWFWRPWREITVMLSLMYNRPSRNFFLFFCCQNYWNIHFEACHSTAYNFNQNNGCVLWRQPSLPTSATYVCKSTTQTAAFRCRCNKKQESSATAKMTARCADGCPENVRESPSTPTATFPDPIGYRGRATF